VVLALPDNLPEALARQAVFCGLPELAGNPPQGGAKEMEGAR